MLKKNEITLVWITSLGGLLEYYDFIIYALMAGYLSEQFFPVGDHTSSLLAAFAAFSVGHISRPLGGLLFGHFGDRYGRKSTFATSVMLMALSTALIGCLPTYHQIGIMAPILITLLRLIQGFSFGGEIPGAITYLRESAPQHQGLVIGFLYAALISGFVIGSLIHGALLELLGTQAMHDWGWRLPFWFGGVLGLFSYMVRKHFRESPAFELLNQEKQKRQIPIIDLLKFHKVNLFIGTLLTVPMAVCMSLLFLFNQGYLTHLLGYHPKEVAEAGVLGICCACILLIFMGYLCDKLSSLKYKVWLMIAGCIIVAALAYPIFFAFNNHQNSLHLIMIACAVPLATTNNLAPLLLGQLFPASIRYSGIAFCYNLCYAIFSGLTPVAAITLINTTDSLLAPAYVLIASGVAGVIASCLFLRKFCKGPNPPRQSLDLANRRAGI